MAQIIKHLYKNKTLRIAIKIIVPVVILAWLFNRLDVSTIAGNLAGTDPFLLTAAFAMLCLRNVAGAYRSKVFLRHRGMEYSTATLTRYYFIGNFFNLFLPEVVGRDLARGYYLYNSSSGKTESVSSIVAERFNGTAALFVLSLVSVAVGWITGLDVVRYNVVRGIAVVFGLFLAATLLIMHERTDRALESLLGRAGFPGLKAGISFARDVITYCKCPSLMARTFTVSLFVQVIGVVATWLISRSLGDTTGFAAFLIIMPMIWVLGMLPVSINGLGVREGSFVVLFGGIGMPYETAMPISLLWFALNICLGIVGWILFAMGEKTRISEKTHPPDSTPHTHR